MWLTRSLRLLASVPAAVGLCLTLSCTGGDASLGAPVADERAPATVDACSLLSATQVTRITSWEVAEGTDHTDRNRTGTRAVCSFSETNHAGAVQVQLAEGAGTEEFDRARSEMEAAGMDGRDVEVAGTTAAYESPDHGVVGMLVEGSFVQVATIGPAVSDDHHLQLAAVVAGNLR